MPNWTWNKITCKKELADKLLTKEEDKFLLDFNKIIPMPKTLKLVAGSIERDSVACYYHSLDEVGQKEIKNILDNKTDWYYGDYYNKYRTLIEGGHKDISVINKLRENYDPNGYTTETFKKFDNIDELGKQYIDNIKQHGCPHWYDWCTKHWGTKWNVWDDVHVSYNEEIDEYEIEFSTAWSIPHGIFEKYFDMCKDGELNWIYEDEDYNGTHILTKENGELVDTVEYYEEEEFDDEEEVDGGLEV